MTQQKTETTDPKKFMAYMKWRSAEEKRLEVEVANKDQSTQDNLMPRLLAFINRKQQVSKPLSFCSCMWQRSWASSVHDIAFHVCEDHAKRFGIHFGPYWMDEVPAIQ